MTERTGRTTDGAGHGHQHAPGDRDYLPAMAKRWLLPLYDPFSRLVGAGKVHRQLLAQADIGPGQRVLEIGCGTGNLLLEAGAAQPAAALVGLDPDGAALDRARRKARRRGLTVQLDRGYADALPYPDGSVDVVLSAFMLHHVPEDEQLPALREVRRVLRPGGRLHLVDMGGREQPGDGSRGRRLHGNRRFHLHTGDGIPDLLRNAGFADVAELASAVRRHTGRITFYRAAG